MDDEDVGFQEPPPDKIHQACKLANTLAKKSETYLESDGKMHPLVGAVILDREGEILASASRGEDGKSHAEVLALSRLNTKNRAKVHTVVSTLEPCCYRGSSNNICCVKEVVRSGAQQVVFGSLDPAPRVRGRGAQILQMRDIYFTTFPKPLFMQAIEINKSYIKFTSEIYDTGSTSRVKSNVIEENKEFDLDYAPEPIVSLLNLMKTKKSLIKSTRNLGGRESMMSISLNSLGFFQARPDIRYVNSWSKSPVMDRKAFSS